MGGSPHRRNLLFLFVLGLVIQGIWTLQLEAPSYADAYYYAATGRRLADGYGLTEPFIWQYLDVTPGSVLSELPVPSHSYWMPMASFLSALGYLFADSFRAAQTPFWLMTGALPLLAYWLSWHLFRRSGQAVAAGVLTAAGGFFSPVWNQPETFAPFAWAGALALVALGLGLRNRSGGWWLLAGAAAGAAHLTRADGLLLLPVGIGLAAAARVGIRYWAGASLALVLGYGSVAGGWLLRNWLVFDRPLSSAGSQTLFLTTYDDLFAFGRRFDWSSYVAWGWENILLSKLQGLNLALQTLLVVGWVIFLAPFVLLAWRAAATRPESRDMVRPLLWYTVALYGAMALLYTYPGQRGGLFHSTAALWPWFMALAPTGIAIAVEGIARRRASWNAPQATRVFTAGAVLLALFISVAAGARGQTGNAVAQQGYPEVSDVLPADAIVAVGDPAAFYYETGFSAVVVPNEPPAGLLAAADAYGVNFVLLDQNTPVPLKAVYEGETELPAISLIASWPRFGLRLFEIHENGTPDVGSGP